MGAVLAVCVLLGPLRGLKPGVAELVDSALMLGRVVPPYAGGRKRFALLALLQDHGLVREEVSVLGALDARVRVALDGAKQRGQASLGVCQERNERARETREAREGANVLSFRARTRPRQWPRR